MNTENEPIGFQIPKKPRITEHEKAPDGRKFTVLPFRAAFDRSINPFAFRVLACIASYANRAGIGYVSQARLASDLNTTQPRISVAMGKLKASGWIQEIGRPVTGIRGATIRVVFDKSLTLDEAISIASNRDTEDLRPVEQRKQELLEIMVEHKTEWTEQELRENKERLAEILTKVFKTDRDKPKLYTPIKGDTQAVKKIKQEIREHMRKRREKEIYKEIEEKRMEGHTQNDIETLKTCLYIDKDMTSAQNRDIPISQTVYKQKNKMLDMSSIVGVFNEYLFSGIKENDLRFVEMLCQINVSESELVAAIENNIGASVKDIVDIVVASR